MNMPAGTTLSAMLGIVVYDVPTKLGKVRPPRELHDKASRINASAWLITAENYARLPIEEWRAQGVDVESAFDQEGMMRLAKRGIRREIVEIKQRLFEACDKASKFYAEAKRRIEDEKVLQKADRKTYMALRSAKLALQEAQTAALAFGFTHDMEDAYDGVKHAMRVMSDDLLADRSQVMLRRTEVKLEQQRALAKQTTEVVE